MKNIFTLFLFASTFSFGQIISNIEGNALGEKTNFNADYIQKNKIKRISGEFMSKRTGQNMRQTGLQRVYEFDRKGRMIKSYETVKEKGKLDTVVSMYEYNNDGQLISERFSDAHGFTAYIYKYDSLGRSLSKDFYRMKNANGSKIDFKPGEQYLVSSETYKYKKVSGKERQVIYNNNNLPYKYKTESTDSLGFKQEELIKYDKSTHLKRTKYFYNYEARIDSVSVEVKDPRRAMTIITYRYDEHGNVDTRNEYKDGKYLYKTEVIYDKATFRVDYIMRRDVITHEFSILKLLNYELYD